MGNPHAVIRLDETPGLLLMMDLNLFDLEKWGPKFENHAWFPQKSEYGIHHAQI